MEKEERSGCPVCFKAFPDIQTLLPHVQHHSLENLFLCYYCSLSCDTQEQLVAHYVSQHPDSSELCIPAVDRHMDKKEPSQCHICLRTFSHQRALSIHIGLEHRKPRRMLSSRKKKKVLKKGSSIRRGGKELMQEDLQNRKSLLEEKKEQQRGDQTTDTLLYPGRALGRLDTTAHTVSKEVEEISTRTRSSEKEEIQKVKTQKTGRPTAILHSSNKLYTREGKKITCLICKKLFSVKLDYKKHLCPRDCSVCGRKCTSENSRDCHIYREHSGRIMCRPCKSVFPNYRVYCTHWRQEHRNSPGNSTRDFKWVVGSEDEHDSTRKTRKIANIPVEAITNTSLKKSQYQCNICGRVFPSFLGIRRHTSEFHRVIGKCEICQTLFSNRSKFQVHNAEKHHELARFQAIVSSKQSCPFCPKVFNSILHLEKHVRFSHEKMSDVQLECLHCVATFCLKTGLDSHLARMHVKIRCGVCLVDFENRSKYSYHKAVSETGDCFAIELEAHGENKLRSDNLFGNEEAATSSDVEEIPHPRERTPETSYANGSFAGNLSDCTNMAFLKKTKNVQTARSIVVVEQRKIVTRGKIGCRMERRTISQNLDGNGKSTTRKETTGNIRAKRGEIGQPNLEGLKKKISDKGLKSLRDKDESREKETEMGEQECGSEDEAKSSCQEEKIVETETDRSNRKKTHMNPGCADATSSRIKPHYQCRICGRNFFSKFSLSRHRTLTHDHSKIIMCIVCEEKFSTVSKFKVHNSKMHKESAGFEDLLTTAEPCPSCSDVFKNPFDLEDHLRFVHEETTAVQFKCFYCVATFWQKRDWRAHMKLTHEKVSCSLCFLVCVNKNQFYAHRNSYHSGNGFAVDLGSDEGNGPDELSSGKAVNAGKHEDKDTPIDSDEDLRGDFSDCNSNTSLQMTKKGVEPKCKRWVEGNSTKTKGRSVQRVSYLKKKGQPGKKDEITEALNTRKVVNGDGGNGHLNSRGGNGTKMANIDRDDKSNGMEVKTTMKGGENGSEKEAHEEKKDDLGPSSRKRKITEIEGGSGREKVSKSAESSDAVETRAKPHFQCRICGRIFSSTRGLTMHTRDTHGTGIVGKCNVCQKLISSKFSSHNAKKHDGVAKLCEIPSSNGHCSSCGDTFRCSSHLKEHVTFFHEKTDASEFKCPHCVATFSCSRNRIYHLSNLHEKVRCSVCSEKLESRRKFYYHKNVAHRGKAVAEENQSEPEELSGDREVINDSNHQEIDPPVLNESDEDLGGKISDCSVSSSPFKSKDAVKVKSAGQGKGERAKTKETTAEEAKRGTGKGIRGSDNSQNEKKRVKENGGKADGSFGDLEGKTLKEGANAKEIGEKERMIPQERRGTAIGTTPEPTSHEQASESAETFFSLPKAVADQPVSEAEPISGSGDSGEVLGNTEDASKKNSQDCRFRLDGRKNSFLDELITLRSFHEVEMLASEPKYEVKIEEPEDLSVPHNQYHDLANLAGLRDVDGPSRRTTQRASTNLHAQSQEVEELEAVGDRSVVNQGTDREARRGSRSSNELNYGVARGFENCGLGQGGSIDGEHKTITSVDLILELSTEIVGRTTLQSVDVREHDKDPKSSQSISRDGASDGRNRLCETPTDGPHAPSSSSTATAFSVAVGALGISPAVHESFPDPVFENSSVARPSDKKIGNKGILLPLNPGVTQREDSTPIQEARAQYGALATDHSVNVYLTRQSSGCNVVAVDLSVRKTEVVNSLLEDLTPIPYTCAEYDVLAKKLCTNNLTRQSSGCNPEPGDLGLVKAEPARRLLEDFAPIASVPAEYDALPTSRYLTSQSSSCDPVPVDLTVVKTGHTLVVPVIMPPLSAYDDCGEIQVIAVKPVLREFFRKPGDKKVFECVVCGQQFRDGVRLRFHMKNRHSGQ